MGTTGVVGQRWRARVTSAGAVEPGDGSQPLRWVVAAADRWHDPATAVGVRHGRIAGTAAAETRMRIPGGDAVQRVWSVADRGGYTLVSVANDSPGPIAVAFTRGGLATTRPPVPVPTGNPDLPHGAVVLPVAHRAMVTVGLAHTTHRAGALPADLPTVDAVTRGWIIRTDVASRLDLPEAALVESVRAARCELLLGVSVDRLAEPERFLIGLGELVRLGELDTRSAIAIVVDVAGAVDSVLARRGPLCAAALDAAAVILRVANEDRALADLLDIRPAATDVDFSAPPAFGADGDVAAIPNVERIVAAGPELFPGGIPATWRGQDLAVDRLMIGPTTRLSLAVRWHGSNVAVLWETDGDPVTLRSKAGDSPWATSAARGEALWRLPARPASQATVRTCIQ